MSENYARICSFLQFMDCFAIFFFSLFKQFQGKRLVFVTNNSTKSRKQYGKKFETLGLSVTEVSDLKALKLCLKL